MRRKTLLSGFLPTALLILILILPICTTAAQEDSNGFPKVIKKVNAGDIRGEKVTKPELEYKPGYLLVRIKSEKVSEFNKELTLLNAKVEKVFKRTGIQLLKVAEGKEREVARDLMRKGLVIYAEPDYVMKAFKVPNDPLFPNQWGLNNPNDADIDAPEAWNITTGSSNVVVAVIDTGVDYTHEDLAANMWTNPREIPNNNVDDDGNGYVDDVYGIDAFNGDSDPYDDNGHGTHVAGIIGAVGNNSVGVSGVAWTVKIMALKFLGSGGWGFTSGAIETIEYLLMMKAAGVNVRIASCSWGSSWYSLALYDAIKMAGENGVLFVIAAGNSGEDADTLTPSYPAAYDLPYIISVAAVNSDGNLAWFTTYGRRSVHIAAPGQDILSTVPGNQYQSLSGTSMATPFVSGVAALLLSTPERANYDPIALKFNILFTAENRGYPVLTGGLLNAYSALSTPPNDKNLHMLILSPYSPSGALYGTVGQKIVIEAMVGTVSGRIPGASVTASIGSITVNLKDDGVPPDKFASDGVYSGEINLTEVGYLTLVISASASGYNSISKSIPLTVWRFNNYAFKQIGYNWIDIKDSGTPLDLGDDGETLILTDFDIKFYGGKYRVIGIGSNGAIAFDDSPAWLSRNSRTGYAFGKMLLPFWEDLVTYPAYDLPRSSNIYVAELGSAPNRVLIIQYNEVPLYMYPDPAFSITFQVRFYENSSDIDIFYKDVIFFNFYYDQGPDKGGLATIGVQYSSSYGIYSEYSFNRPVLSNNMALRLKFIPALYFDFGTDTSPVEPGFARVTEKTTYGSTGYGWTAVQGGSRDRGAPDALRRDFVFNNGIGTFKVGPIPSGLYTVRLIIGDNAYSHDKIDVYIEGALKIDDLNTGAGNFREISVLASVTDNTLDITFKDDGGTDPNWVVNAIYVMEGAYFDFGTPTSPVYKDFVNASNELYSLIRGYGWLSNYKLYARDRGTVSDYLLRDLLCSQYARTFAVAIPTAQWYVVVSLHYDIYPHDFFVNNIAYMNIPPRTIGLYWSSDFYTNQVRITLSDGIGSDPYWVINALYVTSAPW